LILDRKIAFILAINANLALPKLGFSVVRDDLLYSRPLEATLAGFIHSVSAVFPSDPSVDLVAKYSGRG
jgi:hypothetical protein